MSTTPSNKAKILLFDIETSAIKGDAWQRFDATIIHIREYSQILSFAYKWLDEKEIKVVTRQNSDEKKVVKKLAALLDAADIVIAHNGDQFDIKKTNARLAIHNIPPPKPYRTIDTKKVAKKYFNFDSNSLDELARMLGVGKKVKHTGYDMWLGCERNDPESWNLMEKYNKHDVYLLEKVYLRLRPWINTHPNVSQIVEREDLCPKCGSDKLQSRGLRYSGGNTYQRLRCASCGGWARCVAPLKAVKPKITNSNS